jgi:hypothetical protein
MGSIIKKDFVPYDVALDLKNLGFNEECYAHSYTEMEEDFHLDIIPLMRNSDWVSVGAISIPMQHQVFRWLRNEHGYMVVLFNINISTSDRKGHRYCYECWKTHNEEFYITGMNTANPFGFLDYEEAGLECIKKLIEIIKKQ